jgi:ribonucleoside-triphosphate reductase
MVPYVRKSFYKHFKDGLKYAQKYNDRKIDRILGLVSNELSIEDDKYKKIKKAYKYAMETTEKECHQACEALLHNLNTLQSRSGN